jgi:hypothetical protein
MRCALPEGFGSANVAPCGVRADLAFLLPRSSGRAEGHDFEHHGHGTSSLYARRR